ncbi:dirigent protein 17-like [Chenopodium quinoa]|uniref:dirigent protein 17-like n=1 Tax=Chenopodium quinoa TaxID=63459 RepID=UPI000B77A625|nr:dirigent protein 17-like [Chenopodium quinoa]
MEGTFDCNLESLSAGIYELPGEPAVVINGVPNLTAEDGNINQGILTTVRLNKSASDVSKPRNTGFGEWLEGRKVQKLFDHKYYLGKVTEFDKETGWYRVVYEDGDFEDLEWHELQEVLQPLDITMPLKSLALKIIHKNQKSEPGIETNAVPERKSGSKT